MAENFNPQDILKIAMIEIDKLLVRDYGFGFAITAEEREAPVRMLLQSYLQQE